MGIAAGTGHGCDLGLFFRHNSGLACGMKPHDYAAAPVPKVDRVLNCLGRDALVRYLTKRATPLTGGRSL